MPSILWKRNGVPIIRTNNSEENGDTSSDTGKYRIVARPRVEGAHSILDVGSLNRDELRATFSCEATNEISEQPLETAVTVDLICEYLGGEKHLLYRLEKKHILEIRVTVAYQMTIN